MKDTRTPPVQGRSPRRPLSKRTRFEVFKRDQFKCQYCGASAPDIILVVDHIKAVADGGTNDLLNLITACDPCNAGKSDVALADTTAVKKQINQLRVLAERREQFAMLVTWRDGLQNLEQEKVDLLVARVNERLKPLTHHLSPAGIESVRGWLKKFGFDSTLYGIQQAFTADGVEPLIAQMAQFSAAAAKVAREPELRDYWRIRALLRARHFRYGPEWAPIEDMRRAFRDGYSIADMSHAASEAEDYKHFRRLIGYEN